MRRLIGWTLVLVPAGFIALSLISTVVGALVGTPAEREVTDSLIILGMLAVVAHVPIGIGTWLLLAPRWESTGATATGMHSGRGRELRGWALVVPGLVIAGVTVVGSLGSDGVGIAVFGAMGALALVLLVVGTGIVVTERSHRATDPASDADPTPDADPAPIPTPADDREIQHQT